MKTKTNHATHRFLKWPFILFLGSLLIMACEKDNQISAEGNLDLNGTALKRKKGKIDICHYDADTNEWKLLNVSLNAWKAHEKHGDVRLDDQDSDGFVPDNACGFGQMGDCDDTDASINPDAEEVLNNGIDDDCNPETSDDDLDGDGVPDNEDECPDQAGTAENNGCPELTDYEVLRLLYEANPENTLGWGLNDTSMQSWGGVQLNDIGEVVGLEIDIENRGDMGGVTTVPKEFGMLKSLRNLVLKDNGLLTLPPEIGKLSNLETLSFGGNSFTTVPKEIGNLSNLKILAISGTDFLVPNQDGRIVELPSEIGSLSNLEELYITATSLEGFPSEIVRLQNLRVFTILFSKLKSLPAGIQNLNNLETLVIAATPLEQLPIWIGNLDNLEFLNFFGAQLTSLPMEIGNLANLRTLNLESNQLVSIPSELGNLSNLTELRLIGNPVTSIPQVVCDLADADTEVLLDSDDVCQ